MLQFPVNVYPNSQAIDGTLANTFSFIFRGDILAKYQIVIYKSSDGTTVYTGSETTVTKYNGDTVEAIIPSSSFTNAIDYIWTIKLWDSTGSTVTSPNYFFKARTTPTLSVSEITSPHTNRKISITGTYSQAQNVPIRYHTWNLYDSQNNVVDTTDKVYTSNLAYEFDGVLDGETYSYILTLINQDGVSISTNAIEFTVDYAPPDVSSPPKIEFLDDLNAVKVSWVENKQSIGVASGDYEFVSDFPFAGTNSVKINSGEVTFDEVSGQPLSIDNTNFSTIVSTNITNDKQGKIIELSNDFGDTYGLSLDGYDFNKYENDNKTYISSLFSTIESGQTTTGFPEPNVGYIWDDNDIWDDSKVWTESLPFSKQYAVVVKPDNILVEKTQEIEVEQAKDLIAGDRMAGYYGKVNNLITGADLCTSVGLTSGTLIHGTNITWLKFAHKYRTLFVADRAIRTSISWDQIQAQNLVKGKVITIGDRQYLCRLITGGNSNPASAAGGEWDDLIVQFTPNDEDSHWSSCLDWCAEIGSVITTRIRRGLSSVGNYQQGTSSDTNVLFGYRPVLELL